MSREIIGFADLKEVRASVSVFKTFFNVEYFKPQGGDHIPFKGLVLSVHTVAFHYNGQIVQIFYHCLN